MKKVAFFDIDGTIYGKSVFLLLAKYAIQQGWITPMVWAKLLNPLEESNFGKTIKSDKANRFLESVAKELKGKSFDDVCIGVREFFLKNKTHFYPYFEKILPKLKESYDTYIITTNAQFVAKPLVDLFGLAGYISSEFEVVGGIFSGKVAKSLANGKFEVSEILKKYGKEGSIAVGDSENDISMLEQVEFPICMNPSDILKEYAEKQGWVITTSDNAEQTFNRILI